MSDFSEAGHIQRPAYLCEHLSGRRRGDEHSFCLYVAPPPLKTASLALASRRGLSGIRFTQVSPKHCSSPSPR